VTRLATVLALTLALGCSAEESSRRPDGSPKELVGAAPTLLVAGRDLAAEAKGKVLVVDVWATWCEPCVRSLPALDELYRRRADEGLAVVGVAIDEDPRLVPAFLAKLPLSFPTVIDVGAAVAQERWKVARVPTRLVFDRRGVLRGVHEGWEGPEDDEELEAILAPLLAERGSP